MNNVLAPAFFAFIVAAIAALIAGLVFGSVGLFILALALGSGAAVCFIAALWWQD